MFLQLSRTLIPRYKYIVTCQLNCSSAVGIKRLYTIPECRHENAKRWFYIKHIFKKDNKINKMASLVKIYN